MREGGREGERGRGERGTDRGRERASKFDVWVLKMTTSSMFGRHWTEYLLHSLID